MKASSPGVVALSLLPPAAAGADFDLKINRLSPRAATFTGGPWGVTVVAVAPDLATMKTLAAIKMSH